MDCLKRVYGCQPSQLQEDNEMYGSKRSNDKSYSDFGEIYYITFLDFFVENQQQYYMPYLFSYMT